MEEDRKGESEPMEDVLRPKEEAMEDVHVSETRREGQMPAKEEVLIDETVQGQVPAEVEVLLDETVQGQVPAEVEVLLDETVQGSEKGQMPQATSAEAVLPGMAFCPTCSKLLQCPTCPMPVSTQFSLAEKSEETCRKCGIGYLYDDEDAAFVGLMCDHCGYVANEE